jgi:hypothetical protein
MHNVILKQIISLKQHTKFILVNCSEVTTLNNPSYISIHIYVVHNWFRVLILLNLENFINGKTFDNLITIIIHSLIIFSGMSINTFFTKQCALGLMV